MTSTLGGGRVICLYGGVTNGTECADRPKWSSLISLIIGYSGFGWRYRLWSWIAKVTSYSLSYCLFAPIKHCSCAGQVGASSGIRGSFL